MPKSRKAKRAASTQPTSKPKQKLSRRAVLQNAALYGLGGAIVVGAGVWVASSFRQTMAESDLTILGSGMPTIVQIHDPGCTICTGLQRETRAALAKLDEKDIAYRVVDINTVSGSTFASQHGSSYATLLFFDGAGTLTNRIQGATDRATLETAFREHITAS